MSHFSLHLAVRRYWQQPQQLTPLERLRVVCGATLGIAVAAALSHWVSGWLGNPWAWLVAPLGASAVLIFAVAASPMAQPWAVMGGHVIAAVVGCACTAFIAWPELAGAAAVGGAIALMLALRCVHPPAGGTALMMTLSGVTHPGWALFPVGFNAMVLVLTGVLYHRLTGHSYPHHAATPAPALPGDAEAALDADLHVLLARNNQILNVSREDLRSLLHQARLRAYQLPLHNMRCANIMSQDLLTVTASTPIADAQALLAQRKVKALPVVDEAHQVAGIVTQADITRKASPDAHVVGDIMTRQVRVARQESHLVELIPLFGNSGHHHIPIIDSQQRLVGIVTQTDVVAALCQTQPN